MSHAGMMIPISQHKQAARISRGIREKIYMLSSHHNEEARRVTLRICGNTQNVYDARLSKVSYVDQSSSLYTWNCNCPDMRVHAKRDDCVCKHICFLIYKVLKMRGCEADHLVQRNPFAIEDRAFEEYATTIMSRTHEGIQNDVINADLVHRLHNMDKPSSFEPTEEARECSTCPICFDDIVARTMHETCVMCPTCRNLFHKDCMDKVAEHNATHSLKCVYCRSDAWVLYTKDKHHAVVNIAGKGYINLA